jgi:anaerobic selenocysteine-containing dehydrogenase
MKKTACPLDCYDACSVIYEDGKLKGDKNHPVTKGFLCPNLNSFLSTPTIKKPRFQGKEISMSEALEILVDKLKLSRDKRTLYFRGSGNFGVMQEVTSLFFSEYGSDFTKGSLCDGAGEAGVKSGRGESLALPYSQIKKSDVVVVWGRNIDVTNSHMMEAIKDKILIVIDPVKTEIAKMAHLHIQVEPRKDIYVAILMARFAYMEEMEDEEYLESRCEDFDYFLDFIRSYPIKKLMDLVGCEAFDVITALALLEDAKVVFLVGVGVQKYLHGDKVLWMIDSLAAMLGLFGREGCGVSYLSNSSFGFDLPFKSSKKRVSKASVDFGEYDLIFIQGANPLNQLPNSNRVKEGIKRAGFSVYFGLYENQTSDSVDLIIPASSFLEKEDLRFSYSHEYLFKMPKLKESEGGISEYELTKYLMESFGFGEMDSERDMIDAILSSNAKERDGYLVSKSYEDIPYKDEFYTQSSKFVLIDEYDEEEIEGDGEYYLITSKYRHSLNSQFSVDDKLYIHPCSGLSEGEEVEVRSIYGSCRLKVSLDDRVREDCLLIYSGTNGVNNLTPHRVSEEGDSAIYQEVKVDVVKI